MRLLLVVLTCCGWLGAGCGPSSAESPHAVVLLVVDTLRADRLSSYGYSGHETPHIDALAARGTRFTRAHSVASWTVPSMGALLTARHPRQLGLVERESKSPVGPFEVREHRSLTLPPATPHLAESLRAAGFRTAAFVDQPMLSPARGFGRGFEQFFGVVARGEVGAFQGEGEDGVPDWSVTPYAFENDVALVARFREWLAGSESPAFAWVHLLTPHAPYTPVAPFAPSPAAGPMTAAAYDGEVRAVDALVGQTLDAIDQSFGLDRTLVVLTSDHGESFGEHGDIGHGQSLHAEVTRVPLILAGPGVPAGAAVETTVRLLDVAPTVLALAGSDAAATFPGLSLVPLFSAPAEDREVYAEAMLYGPSERSLIRDGFRLLIDEGRELHSLYDVATDPEERRDIAASEPARVRALEAALEQQRARLEAVAPRTDAAALSPDDRNALRALGYVDEAAAPPR
jgi:arylsulfatase A-like enzyme